MITVYINNKKFLFNKNYTILAACEKENFFIPRFCFDKNLKISGNCRMCLVEIEGFINPIASCTFKIFHNIKIFTNSSLSKKSRENILEFLLINHPLDCPICDQGGECDLQDLSLMYGTDKSRFFEKKKTVEDLPYNQIIKTVMTRCILCTKCVRFMDFINNKNNLGIIGRGKNMEIGFYTNNITDFFHKFSANIVDLCPVGALTLQPSSFISRDWLVKKYYDSFDISDNLCSDIVIQVYNNNIIKIVPNLKLDTKYITNSTRFFFNSLYFNRIQNPLKRYNNNFESMKLKSVFMTFKKLLSNYDVSNFNFIIGDSISLNNSFILYNFLNNCGINQIYLKNLYFSNNNDFNSKLLFEKSILKNFDLCLLVGCNLEKENSSLIINLMSKKNIIYNIGSSTKLKYGFIDLGLSLKIFINILSGKHSFCKKLKSSKNPIIIFGEDFLNSLSSDILIDFINKKLNFIKIINIFSNNSLINFMEIFGKINTKKNKIKNKILYLYNTKKFLNYKNKKNNFIIYYGHHFTNDAMLSDIVIPSNTFFEERNIFVNVNGSIKRNFSPIIKFLNNNKHIQINDNIFNYLSITFFFQKNINLNLYFSNLFNSSCVYMPIFKNYNNIIKKKIINNLNKKIIYKNKIKYNKIILETFSKIV